MSGEPHRVFLWSCLALAAISVVGLGWMLNDVRLELKQAATTVNQRLPEIIENTGTTTETLAELSEDVRQLKELAGVAGGPRDQSLVAFASGIFAAIQDTPAQIGLTKKVFGSGLKELQPARQWVVGARKEAIWLTLVCNSKAELVERLCKNKFGSDWQIAIEGQPPQSLLEWLQKNHPPVSELELEPPD